MPGAYFIEEDLAEHCWYVELVADLVEDVELFLLEREEETA
jgi:hypothetical protein